VFCVTQALAAAGSEASFQGKPKSREACVKQLSELASKNATLLADPTAAADYQKQLTEAAASTAAAKGGSGADKAAAAEARRGARAKKLAGAGAAATAAVLAIPEDPPVMATVFGVGARPELNGTQVQLVGYVAERGRYAVREVGAAAVKEGGKPLSLRAASLQLAEVRKTPLLSNLYIKTIILPRQTRDKDRKNSKKVPF
jgi:hypothetical protein